MRSRIFLVLTLVAALLCGVGMMLSAPPAQAVYYVKKKKAETAIPKATPPGIVAPLPHTPPPPVLAMPCTDEDKKIMKSLDGAFAPGTDVSSDGRSSRRDVEGDHKLNQMRSFLKTPGNIEKWLMLSLRCTDMTAFQVQPAAAAPVAQAVRKK